MSVLAFAQAQLSAEFASIVVPSEDSQPCFLPCLACVVEDCDLILRACAHAGERLFYVKQYELKSNSNGMEIKVVALLKQTEVK